MFPLDWFRVGKPRVQQNAYKMRKRKRHRTQLLSALCIISILWLNCIAHYCEAAEEAVIARKLSCHGAVHCPCDYLKNSVPNMVPRLLKTSIRDRNKYSAHKYRSIPFSAYSRLVMSQDSIFFADVEHDPPFERFIFRVDLAGYSAENFQTYRSFIIKKGFPAPLSINRELIERYLVAGQETASYRLHVQGGLRPGQLAAQGSNVVWVDFAPDIRRAAFAANSTIDIATVLAADSSQPCATDIFLYNMETSMVRTLPCETEKDLRRPFPDALPGARRFRLKPSVSGKWAVYEEFVRGTGGDPFAGHVTAVLLNLNTGSSMNLTPTASRPPATFSPKLVMVDGAGPVAAWLRTRHVPRLEASGLHVYFSPGYEASGDQRDLVREGLHVSNVSLEILQVQTMDFVSVQDFSLGVHGHGNAYRAAHKDLTPLVYLHGMELTDVHIFVNLCDTSTLKRSSKCSIFYCSLFDEELGGICPSFYVLAAEEEVTYFDGPKAIHAASSHSVLYWKYHDWVSEDQVGDSAELVYSGVVHNLINHDVSSESWCTIDGNQHSGNTNDSASNGTVLDALVYRNTAIWERSDGRLLLMSLDKDSDSLADVVDVFPTDGLVRQDSDNDGIGDASDFWDSSNTECVSSELPGACQSELATLTILWIVTSVVWFTFVYQQASAFRELYLRVFISLESEAFGVVDVPRSGISQRYLLGGAGEPTPRAKGYNILKSTSKAASMFKKTRRKLYEFSKNPTSAALGANSKALKPFALKRKQKRTPEMVELKKILENVMSGEDIETLRPLIDAKLESMTMQLCQTLRPRLAKLVTLFRVYVNVLIIVTLGTAYTALKMADGTYMVALWIDFFILPVLFCDIMIQYTWYEGRTLQFMKDNIFMLLALWTDLPHLSYSNSTGQVLLRNLKVLKFARLLRAYRIVTHSDNLVTMMVARPERFLALFLAAFLVVCAVVMGSVEWDHEATSAAAEEVSFNLLVNSIWFSAVTVTTVGYGDFAPSSMSGRVISVFMMIVGIGLIGTLSAAIAKAIQTVGATEDKVKQIHADNRSRAEQYKHVLDLAALAFNPVLASMPMIFEEAYELNRGRSLASHSRPISRVHRGQSEAASYESQSSAERIFALDLDVALKMTANPLWTEDTTLMRSYHRVPQRKKDVAQEKLNEILRDRETLCKPRVRLHLVLASFGVDKRKASELVAKLSKVIFTKALQHDIYMERVFAIAMHYEQLKEQARQSTFRPKESFLTRFYQLNDPIDQKLEACEKILREREFQLYKRIDFHLILGEVALVVLEYDRVISTQWALENLQVRVNKERCFPSAPLAPRFTIQAIRKVLNSKTDFKQRNLADFLRVGPDGYEKPVSQRGSGTASLKMANILRKNKNKLARFSKLQGKSTVSAVSKWLHFPRRSSTASKVSPAEKEPQPVAVVSSPPEDEHVEKPTTKVSEDVEEPTGENAESVKQKAIKTKNSEQHLTEYLREEGRLRLSIVEQMLTNDELGNLQQTVPESTISPHGDEFDDVFKDTTASTPKGTKEV